jgi:hypothetical protein
MSRIVPIESSLSFHQSAAEGLTIGLGLTSCDTCRTRDELGIPICLEAIEDEQLNFGSALVDLALAEGLVEADGGGGR